MIVLNLWGAPSSGKSTTAAGLFFLMKINKLKVELVTEFAKDLVWDRNEALFGNQIFIFAEQNRRLQRLLDHGVDFAILDSPLPLPAFYQPKGYFSNFDSIVMETYHSYNNLNYFLNRMGSFEKIGRRHNESDSIQIANDLRVFMNERNIDYTEMEARPTTPQEIFDDLQKRMAPTVGMPLPLPIDQT